MYFQKLLLPLFLLYYIPFYLLFFTIHVYCPFSLVATYTTYLHAFYLCHFFLLKSPVFAAAPDMFSPLPPVLYCSHKSYAFLLLFNIHYYFLKIHCKSYLYALYNTLYYFLHVTPSRRYPLNYYNLCIVLVYLGYFLPSTR